jgi:micrococcal nuclease
LDNGVPFRPKLRHRLWQFKRRYPWRRIARKPWVVVVAVFGAAIAGWFAPDLRASGVVASLSNPDGVVAWASDAVVLRPGGGESGSFRMCSRANRYNCVVDGDTIWYGGVKIRLADIDTPEVFSPKCASEAALGRQATERLLALINAGPFEVVPGSRDEDRYGRKLRTIERNGRSLGDVLIAEGLARPWDGARRSWCG